MTVDAASKLSANDAQILAALFDPESSASAKIADDKSETFTSQSLHLLGVGSDILGEERGALLLLNAQDPSFEDIESALTKLTHVCEQAPNYASTWCNRAQAGRLYLMKLYSSLENKVGTPDLVEIGQKHPQLLRRVFSDLDTAIRLASPTNQPSHSSSVTASAPSLPLSFQARVLAAAYTHRGYLLWQYARTEAEFDVDSLPSPFTGMSKHSLEDMASREFALGGKYGNEIARKVSVKTNPYAKLCGNIVKEAMRKEMEGSTHVAIYLGSDTD